MVVKVLDDAGFVDPITYGERDRRGRERVIHHAIERAVRADPTLGLVPDLTGDVGVRVHRSNATTELIPKARRADLVRNIEAPAIDPLLDPIGSNAPQELANRFVFGIELRQRMQTPPRVIGNGRVLVVWSDGKASDVEPVEKC